ncbi:hypothetical protein NEOLEDRAFT_1089702 [Neolentinus lepideus HHB14362 ss-1]|uniref:Uncharacterized protein n=1 Tax=Neolentinus lepideus HHB14362 ss-1 TaxID=1314782 RepID=A0A165TNY4_9AGAM|nr:hypothetical protein NEOLEDRAFT_1089702 [Neolentinus lepideus HHB14362 ss-1]
MPAMDPSHDEVLGRKTRTGFFLSSGELSRGRTSGLNSFSEEPSSLPSRSSLSSLNSFPADPASPPSRSTLKISSNSFSTIRDGHESRFDMVCDHTVPALPSAQAIPELLRPSDSVSSTVQEAFATVTEPLVPEQRSSSPDSPGMITDPSETTVHIPRDNQVNSTVLHMPTPSPPILLLPSAAMFTDISSDSTASSPESTADNALTPLTIIRRRSCPANDLYRVQDGFRLYPELPTVLDAHIPIDSGIPANNSDSAVEPLTRVSNSGLLLVSLATEELISEHTGSCAALDAIDSSPDPSLSSPSSKLGLGNEDDTVDRLLTIFDVHTSTFVTLPADSLSESLATKSVGASAATPHESEQELPDSSEDAIVAFHSIPPLLPSSLALASHVSSLSPSTTNDSGHTKEDTYPPELQSTLIISDTEHLTAIATDNHITAAIVSSTESSDLRNEEEVSDLRLANIACSGSALLNLKRPQLSRSLDERNVHLLATPSGVPLASEDRNSSDVQLMPSEAVTASLDHSVSSVMPLGSDRLSRCLPRTDIAAPGPGLRISSHAVSPPATDLVSADATNRCSSTTSAVCSLSDVFDERVASCSPRLAIQTFNSDDTTHTPTDEESSPSASPEHLPYLPPSSPPPSSSPPIFSSPGIVPMISSRPTSPMVLDDKSDDNSEEQLELQVPTALSAQQEACDEPMSKNFWVDDMLPSSEDTGMAIDRIGEEIQASPSSPPIPVPGPSQTRSSSPPVPADFSSSPPNSSSHIV